MAYQQVEQESNSIGSLWWETQQMHSMVGMMKSSNWNGLAAGKGYNWGGVLGARRLALGENAISAGGALSKWSPVGMAQRAATKYGKGGGSLAKFGKGGVAGMFGRSDGPVGKFLGGGTVLKADYSAFTSAKSGLALKRGAIYMKQDSMSRSQALKKGHKYAKKIIDPFAKRFNTSVGLGQTVKGIFGLGDDASKIKDWAYTAANEFSDKAGPRDARKFMSIGKSHVRNMRSLQLASKIGKGVSAAAWLTFGYEMASWTAQGAIGTAGAAAESLQQQFGGMFNNRQEFGGGQLAPGFISSRASTERQRALSAMKRGYAGRGLQGSEASLMHK